MIVLARGLASARGWVLLLALLAVASPALAQEPLPGLEQEPELADPVGPATADAQRPPATATVQTKRLDLAVSFYSALDMTSVTDVRHVFTSEPLFEDRTGYAGGSASMNYTYQGKENTFGAAGGTGLRYYSGGLNTFYPNDFYTGFNFSRRLSRRVRFRGSESLTFSPYYAFGSAPITGDLSQLIAPQFNQAVNRTTATTSNTSVGLTWQLSRKSSLNVGYVFDYVDAATTYNVHTMGANGSYQYQKTRYLSIRRVDGFYRSQLFGQAVPYYDTHNIDGGVGYRRPLSFSRRSVVGFNIGSSVVTDGVTQTFWVTGDASLTHQLSQFWSLSFAYNRSVSRLGGVATPYLTDLGSVAVGGLVTKKLSLTGTGSFTRGASATGVQNSFDAAYATGHVGYPITHLLPLYAEDA